MTDDFGHYKILSEIGRGGMGIVYQAEDQRDKRIVAIKQLVFANLDPAKEREFRDRFRREAATAARLIHPNIVTVFDVSTEGDNYFYVMERLEGHNLRRELELNGGRLSPAKYWPIFAQVVEGLSFAHSMNVVHRDVKPDNIFILSDGRVKITDFGIARAADFEQTHLTKTGVMMGTLAYVSPEQLQDAKNVDHRADIFSLGVVSYESLSGQVPFTGDGIAQTIVKIVSQEEKPLHIMLPYISVKTSTAVTKALRKRARERFRSVKDFAKDFQDSLNSEGEELYQVPSCEPSHPAAPAVTEAGAWPEQEDIKELRAKLKEQPGPVASDYSVASDYLSTGQVKLGEIGGAMETMAPTSSLVKPSQEVSMRSRPQQPAPQAHSANPADTQLTKPIHIFDSTSKNQKFEEPAIICYRSGRVLVADTATRAVHIFSFEGRWVGDLVMRPDVDTKTRGGSLTKPSGIAIDDKGRVYLVDSSDPYVRVFDSKGLFFKEFCNIQGKDGGLQGIALDSTGLIYLSDVVNGCVQVFQSDLGLWMRKIGGKGQGDAHFQLPAGLAIDRLNQLYCADYGTSKICIFNKAGNFMRSFGGKGTGPGLFNVPRSVAVDNNDKIYVLDSLNHRIQVFGPTGDWFYTFGGRGSEPGKFMSPSDLSIDSANNLLYVADKGNKRIQVFEIIKN